MYGDKARIGLIVPSTNTVAEPEFNAMKPDGVSVHATRVLLASGTMEGLRKMDEGVEEAAQLLASAGVNIIALACTTGSLIKGIGWDQEIISTIERKTSIPATTTATAVINAFRELGIGKVAVATPYNEELNQAEEEFFEAHGVKVVNMKGLGVVQAGGLRDLSPETTYKLACEVNTTDADAVFISCTGFKTITVLEELEESLHKCVFSSNTATMWDILKKLGIHGQINGLGKLMMRL